MERKLRYQKNISARFCQEFTSISDSFPVHPEDFVTFIKRYASESIAMEFDLKYSTFIGKDREVSIQTTSAGNLSAQTASFGNLSVQLKKGGKSIVQYCFYCLSKLQDYFQLAVFS